MESHLDMTGNHSSLISQCAIQRQRADRKMPILIKSYKDMLIIGVDFDANFELNEALQRFSNRNTPLLRNFEESTKKV